MTRNTRDNLDWWDRQQQKAPDWFYEEPPVVALIAYRRVYALKGWLEYESLPVDSEYKQENLPF